MARILLGVSGGIAAYKAVELVRLATGAGHSVRVVQTEAAERFVGRATFEGITGAPVLVDEFEPDPVRGAYPGDPAPDHAPISHLELVRRADVYAIAPATANTLAKLATGLADNLLTAAALACDAPMVLAPAMNDRMWAHPATQRNVETLRSRGASIVPPATGSLASRGEWGTGRLAEPPEILAAIEEALRSGPYAPRPLDGLRLLGTAGGTREPIDSVRFVGNRPAGRRGRAVAAQAARRSAGQVVVGFAAEHGEGAVERARGKLERKGLDAVVVNDISRADIGFDVPENEVTIVTAAGTEQVPRASKSEVAGAVLDVVERL